MNENSELYNKWIAKNYPDMRSALGNCKSACEKMKEAFPELVITNGFVSMWINDREYEHWWLKDPNGNIIDPTVIQFVGMIDYEEIDDDHPARKYPRCKCMNCGEHFYLTEEAKKHNPGCSDKCYKELVEYLS